MRHCSGEDVPLMLSKYKVFPSPVFPVTLSTNQSGRIASLFYQWGNQYGKKLIICLRFIASARNSDSNPSPMLSLPLLILELHRAPSVPWVCVCCGWEAGTSRSPGPHGGLLFLAGGPPARARNLKQTTGMRGQPSPPSPFQVPVS